MKRGQATQGTVARTASAKLPLRRGADESTGEYLTGPALAQRVAWCADLIASMVADLLDRRWNTADVARLAAGVDPAGRPLPLNAWMALRRLGWGVVTPEGVTLNDRIVRMAQEQAGRVLRGAHWRAKVTAGILQAWPESPTGRTTGEWEAVRAAIPDGPTLPSNVIKARTRQVTAFTARYGRMPVDLFELEPTPRVAPMQLLSACDRQQATLERCDDPDRALLRVQLPTRPDPASYRDWTWVACPIALPRTVPPAARLHLPTLRVLGSTVRADLPFTYPVPKARRAGHVVALGVDWGLNTLLSAGAGRLGAGGRITTLGAGGQYRAAGVLAKQHRLRRHGEQLHAKTGRYRALLTGRPEDLGHRKRLERLETQTHLVASRRSHLNEALAWSAARWTVDEAIAAGASVIYLEDLRSMEARGMGRTVNTRLSQTVRGKIAERVRHLAGETGIAVVTVPARDTSRRCPRCLAPLGHRKAPDQPESGWKWAVCPNRECAFQGDRDQGAWQRIAARGLTHQNTTSVDCKTGTMTIRTVKDHLEARAIVTPAPTTSRDRSKTGPTRPRTRPAPRRRAAPSPTARSRALGQRPEGRAHTDRDLPRAATRNQGASTASNTHRTRHKPRGGKLGAGFHLHAHATLPRWVDPTDPATAGSRRIT